VNSGELRSVAFAIAATVLKKSNSALLRVGRCGHLPHDRAKARLVFAAG
jgi:hypothetical protein